MKRETIERHLVEIREAYPVGYPKPAHIDRELERLEEELAELDARELRDGDALVVSYNGSANPIEAARSVEIERIEKNASYNRKRRESFLDFARSAPDPGTNILAGNPKEEHPGYTDSDGDRWDFFQHSSGLWVTVCASMGGEALAIDEKERGEPADKLRAWLKKTGRA